MRTLPAELLAAQQSRTQAPYIEYLRCTSRRWGVQPLPVSPLYTETATGQAFAACVAPDGSVCRVRITGAGDIYFQRVPDPLAATAATWSAWTLLGAALASSVVPPALGAGVSLVNMVYVRPDGYTVVRRFSSNNGATYSGEAGVAADAAAPVRAVAVAGKPATNDRLFVWAAGPNVLGGDPVEIKFRTLSPTGVYGVITLAPIPRFAQVEGLALEYGGDWHVAITGQGGGGDRPWGVFLTQLGDGYAMPSGLWSAPGTLQRADAGTQYGYTTPSLAAIAGAYRCATWTRRPGGPNRMETAHRVSSDYATTGWTTPAPAGVSDAPAALLALPGGQALFAGERSVWALTTVTQTLEFGSRLAAYTYTEPGGMEIVLAGAASPAELDVLRPGSGVALSRGLLTTAGPRALPLPELEIVSVRRVTGLPSQGRAAGGAVLLVQCRGAVDALGAWRANRSIVWSRNTTVASILKTLCGYAGIDLGAVGNPTSQMLRQPEFTVSPGESAAGAAGRLLDLVPERLRPQGARLLTVDPEAATTAYLYGHGGHPLLGWELGARPVEPNHAQVYARAGGTTIYGEALDTEGVIRHGRRLLKLYDASVANASEARGRAEARLGVARREASTGALRTMPHLGLELWDRVEVKPDAAAAPEPRAVTAFRETYNPSAGEWSQTVTLGGDDHP